MKRVRIDCHPCPSVAPDEIAVVIDVIRATTTAATAVATGRRCFAVPSVTAAFQLAAVLPGALLAGEVGGVQPEGFELDNSPAAMARRSDVERPLVLLSSSGTPLLHSVGHCREVLVACLRNHGAVARALARRHRQVVLLGAPSRGQFREEDQLCCALIAARLARSGHTLADVRTRELVDRWAGAPVEAILTSPSVAYLRRSGRLDDLELILRQVDDLDRPLVYRAGEVLEARACGPAPGSGRRPPAAEASPPAPAAAADAARPDPLPR
jgi:2-phosphosulfolactate phosphatase